MSSRSNSPKPPASGVATSAGGGGNGGSLSNDQLYAPLSTYSTDNNVSKKKSTKQQQHSLSINTSTSLRESSLMTFLTSMSQSLKTSHPSHEYQIYRGIGGSISKFGMGDTDRVSASMRGLLESKLSNRSLILVGGGVHKVGSTKVDDSMGNNGSGLVSGSHNTTSSSGKRVRKRVGGNGIFGSISNKKRKKLLNQISLEKQQKQQQQHSKGKTVDSCELQIHDGEEKPANPLLNNEEQSKSGIKPEIINKKEVKSNTINTAQVHEKVGSIVETLHKMWLSYIKQLLSTIKHIATSDSSQMESSQLSVHDYKQISFLLATAEHVGMPATIVECPSRRHLVHCRCVIVNETKETYSIAMIKSKSNKKQDKKKSDEKQVGASEVSTKAGSDSLKKDANDKSTVNKYSYTWKTVLVPKHGTVLDIDLPRIDDNTVSASNNDGDDEASQSITVRLQT